MPLLLYTATAALMLLAAHRFIRPLSFTTALLLYLLPFVFVGRALVTGGVYGPIDIAYATEPLLALRQVMGVAREYTGSLGDIAYQMIPWRKAVQWAIWNGEWPLWNPFILSGDILAASAQPAAYSPFTLIALLLPVGTGLTYSAAVTFFVAGWGAFLFARELGCAPVPSLIAAAGWMYSSTITFFILWPLGFTWAFLPAVLIGARLVVHEPSIRSAAILCASLTLLILAGHPETVLHVVSIGCVYSLVELLARRRQILRTIGFAVCAGAAALALTAVYLLPVLEAAPQTIEHPFRAEVFSKAERGAPAVAVAARIGTDLLPFMYMRTWRIEGVTPFSPESGAVGSIVLACAIYALIAVRSRQAWFLGGLALFGFLAAGNWTPVARTLQKIPLFDIALNERLVFASAFSLAVLAGMGVDALVRAPSRRSAAVVMTVVLLLVAGATALIESKGLAGPNLNPWGDFKIAADIGLLALAAALVTLPLPARVVPPILLALVLVQRSASDGGMYPVYPAAAAYPRLPVVEAMKRTTEPFRVVSWNLGFIPGTSALYELEDVRGYQAMTFASYYAAYPLWCHHQPVWFNKVIDLTRPFLSLLNVRYALVPRHYDPPDGWRLFAEDRTGRVLENTRVIDRVFLPRTLRVGIPAADALSEMANETDFRERAWISAEGPAYERPNASGRLTVRRKGTTYHIDADMDDDGWIVVSEKAWKGWRAYVDGRRVRTTVANVSFLSVFVPRGQHRLRLVYRPDSFVTGRAISLIALLSVTALAAIRTVRRRWRRRRVPS